MELLYALHLPVTLLLSLTPLWFSVRVLRLPWINPFSIALAVALPVQLMKLLAGPLVLLDDGIFDVGYQFALLMTDVQSLAQLGGLLFFYKLAQALRLERFLPMKRVMLQAADFARTKWLFLALFGVAFFLLAHAEFGVLNWIANPRAGYQLYRTGQGQWYAMAVSCVAVAYLMDVLQKPRPGAIIVSTAFFMALVYLLGSKGNMLAVFVSALIFLWFLDWKHLGRVFLIGTPLLFGLLVVNLFLALGNAFDLQSVLEYFDYYKNAADYYNAYLNDQLPLFWGKVSLSSLWGYVPRSLAPDKPVVYGVLLVNEFFYPGQAELTNTPAFGGAVEQFADFGVIGVIVFGFFSSQSIVQGLLSYLIFRKPGIKLQAMSLGGVALLLIQFAPSFGLFLPGFLYVLLLGFVLFSMRVLRGRPTRPARPTRPTRPTGPTGPAEGLPAS